MTPSAVREDRERLRSLLGWDYEAHARVVDGLLALLPGLRALAGNDDLVAGLVAVRAELSPIGPRTDAVLRGETPSAPAPDEPEQRPVTTVDAELLARCASSGLRRLPAVVGPVFRAGTSTSAVLSQYRSGLRLVEPAFTEARMDRWVPAGSTVEYAIWSFSGRRTDRLMPAPGHDDRPRVMFPAGSHFLVLGVEEAQDGAPVRVFLREVPVTDAGGNPAVEERTRKRLREAVDSSPVDASGSTAEIFERWRRAIGVGNDGALFATTAEAS